MSDHQKLIRAISKSIVLMFLIAVGNCFAAAHDLVVAERSHQTRYERMSSDELRQEIFSVWYRFSAEEAAHYDERDAFCPVCPRRRMPYLMGIGCALMLHKYFPLDEEPMSWFLGGCGIVLGKVIQRSGEPVYLTQERALAQMRLGVLRERLREKEKQD